MENPQDYHARAEVQWLASIAHNNLLDTGRVSDWACHRIEHELSAQYGMTHGEGMAIVLLGYLKYISEKHPHKTAQLANRLYHVDYHNYTECEMTLILREHLYRFFRKLNLKTSLKEADISEDCFTEMALRGTNNNQKEVGHYYPLDKDKFVEVLRLCL